jgi:hypothetical protein
MKTTPQTLLATLVVLLVFAGCASKQPSPNLCASVCDGLVAYYPFYGDATDKSGNGHDGKVIGATLTKDRNGYPNSAYLFNGKGSMIEPAKSSELNNLVKKNYSIAIWVRIHQDTGKQMILVNFSGNSGPQHNGLVFIITKSKFQMRHWGTESQKYISATARKPIRYGDYHHVVGTVDSLNGRVVIYIDGEIQGERSWNVDSDINLQEVSRWGIGRAHTNNFNFPLSGTVDEVRLYNRALSADEVKELYLFTSAFPPAE